MGIPYMLELRELSRRDVPLVGVKAANLGELLAAGFSVPNGFVLTTAAFERFIEQHGLDPTESITDISATAMPEDVFEAVHTIAATLGDASLAVRSSGVAEDLAGSSFAGQYETVLGVRGMEALTEAVIRCWLSAFNLRVTTYRSLQRDQLGFSPLAILIQLLVKADAAGVAFTANPVTGERSETLVSAVRGLGERLVSGLAQPDEWLVRETEAVCIRAPERALDVSQVTAVAELARRVQAYFGPHQDVEWVLSGGQLHVVQARPITALPDPPAQMVPVPVDPPPGFWQREVTHAPRPISPLIEDWVTAASTGQNAAFREMFETFGLLAEGLTFREIGGWVYVRMVPLGGKDRKSPPSWLMWLLVRTIPKLRSRVLQARRVVRSDLHGQLVERWYEEWRPSLADRIHNLAVADLPSLSANQLEEHVATVSALTDECLHIHFQLHGAMVMVMGEFLFACEDLLGWSDQDTFRLLAGLSEMSSEPTRRLADLAAMASGDPSVLALLGHIGDDTVDQLSHVAPEYAAAFHEYLSAYGCRALRYDPVDPTLAESPELVLRLIRDQIARGYDPSADNNALEEARTAVKAQARAAAQRAGDVDRFERVLARAERTYPLREDSEFYTASAPIGLIRYAALELGRRLAVSGQLGVADDIFWLRLPEGLAALHSGNDQRALVLHRRGERAWVEAHPGPASFGADPGSPPSMRILPKESRFAMEAFQRVLIDRILAIQDSQRRQDSGDNIAGIAAAPGRYTGPVRVVMDETEFDKITPGDVLVCPITSPVWSVLFPSIGALVTDTGGILSHAAIIAREYRLPAVVATGNATALLNDGQVVTVDGDRGVVEVADLTTRSIEDAFTEIGEVQR